MLSVAPFPMMSEYKDSEDLYTIVSAYSTSNLTQMKNQQSILQFKTSEGKRS